MADKITSGSAGLDEVLHGGIPVNTITVLMGAPGTGKTILAEQLAFAHATPETPVLYLTTLSEPLEKFIAHGQKYSFFDSSKIGASVFYEDLGLLVRERGISKLPEMLTNLLIAHRPKFVFIDSFKALNDLLVDEKEQRTVTYDLASVLTSYECTSFLVGEYSQEMMTELPEFAIADVVLQMIKYATNIREQRFIRVEKMRGSDSMAGMHACVISEIGITVYPRLFTPEISPDYLERLERVETGIPGLDKMISQGFWRGSTTLIAGPTGSGKTIIGLHFICAGAQQDEVGLYVGLQENPIQLLRTMRNFGWEPDKLLKSGSFELMYRSPVELQLDSITAEILKRVRKGPIKRVVIDALGDLERSSIDKQRFADFIYALTQWFAKENVTCLLLYELSGLFEIRGISEQEISNMSDNIVLLRFFPDVEMERTIRVIKTRASAHDNREHKLSITNRGVAVENARK